MILLLVLLGLFPFLLAGLAMVLHQPFRRYILDDPDMVEHFLFGYATGIGWSFFIVLVTSC